MRRRPARTNTHTHSSFIHQAVFSASASSSSSSFHSLFVLYLENKYCKQLVHLPTSMREKPPRLPFVFLFLSSFFSSLFLFLRIRVKCVSQQRSHYSELPLFLLPLLCLPFCEAIEALYSNGNSRMHRVISQKKKNALSNIDCDDDNGEQHENYFISEKWLEQVTTHTFSASQAAFSATHTKKKNNYLGYSWFDCSTMLRTGNFCDIQNSVYA